MGLTLDDLRQPGFGGRVWGYDRDEVDQLLASVVVSIERLQRRRQRDAEAIERATNEAREALERAERAERERDELAGRLELADEAAERAVADADRRAQQLVSEAEARAEQARQASTDAGGSQSLPLAMRAARALLADARERSVAIEAAAHHRAGVSTPGPRGDGADDGPGDHSKSPGSSATIHS
ncbi:MAG TPA: DivIVA domain-containing protein [Acidimicrobiales bacterium]|nr:DivIVA domain-containing protein [Acidimicrobiales bacterium]